MTAARRPPLGDLEPADNPVPLREGENSELRSIAGYAVQYPLEHTAATAPSVEPQIRNRQRGVVPCPEVDPIALPRRWTMRGIDTSHSRTQTHHAPDATGQNIHEDRPGPRTLGGVAGTAGVSSDWLPIRAPRGSRSSCRPCLLVPQQPWAAGSTCSSSRCRAAIPMPRGHSWPALLRSWIQCLPQSSVSNAIIRTRTAMLFCLVGEVGPPGRSMSCAQNWGICLGSTTCCCRPRFLNVSRLQTRDDRSATLQGDAVCAHPPIPSQIKCYRQGQARPGQWICYHTGANTPSLCRLVVTARQGTKCSILAQAARTGFGWRQGSETSWQRQPPPTDSWQKQEKLAGGWMAQGPAGARARDGTH